jgi:hypothetical protein
LLISPLAYEDALDILGKRMPPSSLHAFCSRLKRSILLPTWALTDMASAGEFSVGPVLMGALKTYSLMARMTG